MDVSAAPVDAGLDAVPIPTAQQGMSEQTDQEAADSGELAPAVWKRRDGECRAVLASASSAHGSSLPTSSNCRICDDDTYVEQMQSRWFARGEIDRADTMRRTDGGAATIERRARHVLTPFLPAGPTSDAITPTPVRGKGLPPGRCVPLCGRQVGVIGWRSGRNPHPPGCPCPFYCSPAS